MLAWLSVCSKVQMACTWSSWCHCHPIIIASRNPKWFILLLQAYLVVLEKKLLNDCCCYVLFPGELELTSCSEDSLFHICWNRMFEDNQQMFYRLDVLPVAQPAVSKHWINCKYWSQSRRSNRLLQPLLIHTGSAVQWINLPAAIFKQLQFCVKYCKDMAWETVKQTTFNPGQTNSIILTHHVDLYLWPWVTFNPLWAMVMIYSHTKDKGQRSLGSKARLDTNKRTDGQTEAITLPDLLMRWLLSNNRLDWMWCVSLFWKKH